MAARKKRPARRARRDAWVGNKFYYHIPRLTKTEYATLEWLADRGYDGNILKIAGVEEFYADGSVQLGDLREHQAWEFRDYVQSDPDAFLASSGSRGLNEKLLDLHDRIV